MIFKWQFAIFGFNSTVEKFPLNFLFFHFFFFGVARSIISIECECDMHLTSSTLCWTLSMRFFFTQFFIKIIFIFIFCSKWEKWGREKKESRVNSGIDTLRGFTNELHEKDAKKRRGWKKRRCDGLSVFYQSNQHNSFTFFVSRRRTIFRFFPEICSEREKRKKNEKMKGAKIFNRKKTLNIHYEKPISVCVCVLGTVMHSVYPSLVRSYFHFAKSILICFPSHTYLPIYGDWHMHKASTRISKESVPSFPMEWREEKRTKWIERMKMWKRDVGKGI